MQLAVADLYRARGVRPYSIFRAALVYLLLGYAVKVPIVWSPFNRDLFEQLAGTAVVLE